MAVKKLMESTLPEIFEKLADEEANQIVHASYANKVADVIFEAVTKCLSATKREDKPVAFIFEELNGNFIAGAIVQFHDGGDDAGNNWSYVWTFDRSDIPNEAKEIKMTDVPAHQFFNGVSSVKYHFSIKNDCIVNLYTCFMKCLSQWLTDNATAGDTVSIELENVFEARVAVEGESVVKSLEVSGELKTLIKDDAAIEK